MDEANGGRVIETDANFDVDSETVGYWIRGADVVYTARLELFSFARLLITYPSDVKDMEGIKVDAAGSGYPAIGGKRLIRNEGRSYSLTDTYLEDWSSGFSLAVLMAKAMVNCLWHLQSN
jgi:hypothetical protein